MNERFKFRAWDKQEKIMLDNVGAWGDSFIVQGADIEGAYLDTIPTELLGIADGDLVEIGIGDRYIVEPCIGILDRDRKPIFENDILRMSNSYSMPEIEVVVKWKRGAWWLEFDDASDDTMDSLINEGAVFEVIGNIHKGENNERAF